VTLPSPDPRPTVAHWRRAASLAVALTAVALVIVPAFRSRPSRVDVAFRLGAAREGLRRMTASYQASPEETALRVSFDYSATPAPEEQTHHARLPDGEYRVVLDLLYAKETPSGLRSASSASGARGPATIRVTRPLIVRGDGSVRVFVLTEPAGE
jgi:hypothetical protein